MADDAGCRKVATDFARRSQVHGCIAQLGPVRSVLPQSSCSYGSTIRSHKPIANLVLQDTTERMFVQDLYADVKHGVYIVRGENVLLLGEIVRSSIMLSAACLPLDQDLDQEDDLPEPYRE